ncbi:unnamed protein product, partial [Rotaria sordida]
MGCNSSILAKSTQLVDGKTNETQRNLQVTPTTQKDAAITTNEADNESVPKRK